MTKKQIISKLNQAFKRFSLKMSLLEKQKNSLLKSILEKAEKSKIEKAKKALQDS